MSERLLVYSAGALFDSYTRLVNVRLAQHIEGITRGRVQVNLPQSFVAGQPLERVRGLCLYHLICSDLVIANADGTQVDDGTVFEVAVAMFAGIPVVWHRDDFRGAGDSPRVPLNIMLDGGSALKFVGTPAILKDATARREIDASEVSTLGLEFQVANATLTQRAHDIVNAMRELRSCRNFLPVEEVASTIRTLVRTVASELHDMLTPQVIDGIVGRRRRSDIWEF
ncbi:MAG: hypothetical protein IT290_10310 [Deltaproteobacteria bacterium]|nr:hypothetical protein [Deltaproteobacteria bacterium]